MHRRGAIVAKIDCSDLAALKEAEPLLRFAAERIKNLDPDLALAIAEAREAADSDKWSPQVSQRFWHAFAKLCDLIQPATMDCLAAAQPNIEPPRWLRFLGLGKKSIAERSSSRYLFALLVLLVVIQPIQLYVWTCTNLSKKIDDLLAAERAKYTTLVQDFNKLDVETRNTPAESWSEDQRARASKIITDSISIQDDIDRINAEASLLGRVSLGLHDGSPSPRKPVTQWYEYYGGVVDQFSKTQLRVVEIQEKANLIVGVIGAYILAILFGTIGAVAYIIRTISEQIRTTFSTSSPIRHIMRAALGATAGLVVGLFSDLSSKFSLQPLAVAFLAGYGVEALFSMFDGFIAKFK
jgi:hypothetical protein